MRRRWLCTTRKCLAPEKTGVERSVFNLEAVTARCDKEGKSVVMDYVSTRRTYTTRTHATGSSGTETNFRVTVAAHESNCKITS